MNQHLVVYATNINCCWSLIQGSFCSRLSIQHRETSCTSSESWKNDLDVFRIIPSRPWAVVMVRFVKSIFMVLQDAIYYRLCNWFSENHITFFFYYCPSENHGAEKNESNFQAIFIDPSIEKKQVHVNFRIYIQIANLKILLQIRFL